VGIEQLYLQSVQTVSYSHSNSRSNSDANSNGHGHSHAYANRHTNSNGHANPNTDRYSDSNRNSDSHAHAASNWTGGNVNSGPGVNLHLFERDFYLERGQRDRLCPFCRQFLTCHRYLQFGPSNCAFEDGQ
jgi:hypothetical protein